jgi:carbon monoxide dehydrogenase subunit G
MELEHSFTVPVPLDRAWDVLLDVERVAPCMPGASLDSVNGDEIKGRIKVKVGPISMTYAGTARFTERDAATGVMKLEATGKETRGAGTASATVRSELHGEGDETHVVVHTSLNVTGRPAQFGRGVMSEVSGKLIGIFAANLASMLTADNAGQSPAPAAAGDLAEAGPSAGPDGDLALPVEELHLALRSYNSLRRDGIHTIGELAARTEQQLLAIDHIGPASVEEIRQKLAGRGLSLTAGAGSTAGTAASGTAATGTVAAGAPAGPAGSLSAGAQPADADGPGSSANGDTAGSRSAANGGSGQPAAAPGPRPAPAAARPPDEDAIDLLSVAGLPVLKRAIPVLGGLLGAVAIAIALRIRLRRRRAGR